MYARHGAFCQARSPPLPDIRNTENSASNSSATEGGDPARQLSGRRLQTGGRNAQSVSILAQKRMNSGGKRLVLVIGGRCDSEGLAAPA